MKKNGLFSAKSFLTLVSVLSMLLGFTAVCAGVLFTLNRMHLLSFPEDEVSETNATQLGDADVSIPNHAESEGEVRSFSLGTAAYETLASSIPFCDNFYQKLRVVSEPGSELPLSGTYELWRYGENYRINYYDVNDEVERIITCDGKRIQIINFSSSNVEYYVMSEEYSFIKMAPFPNLSLLLEMEHELFEYSEVGDLCTAACEYWEMGMIDETKFYKSTGLLQSYKRMADGRTVMTIEKLAYDLDFAFSDDMFAID